MGSYDSRADTLVHSQRVGELMIQIVNEVLERSTKHDRSKTESPELEIFNEYTQKLKDTTYGSEEYARHLKDMGAGLQHHYAHNRHHPEHFINRISGMNLVDVIEMLADWRAATERHDDGDIIKSLQIQQGRFEISDQLLSILLNTVKHFGWDK